MKRVLIACVALSGNAWAGPACKVTAIHPDRETKEYMVTLQLLPLPKIPGSSWKCEVEGEMDMEPGSKMWTHWLRCVAGSAHVQTLVVTQPGTRDSAALHLVGPGKYVRYILTCDH